MVEFQNNISNYSASLASSPVKLTISNGQFFAKSAIKMHGEPKTTATLRFSHVQGFSDFLQVILLFQEKYKPLILGLWFESPF